MKNKLRRKLTALALCGVMIFSGSSSALADSQAGEIDENQIVQEQVLDEVIEEADTEVQEPAVEEATQELVPETVEPVIEEAPVEEVVEEVVEEPQEEIPTEEVVEEQPQVEIQEVEAQPTVVEQVVEAVATATEKVVEVVETVIRYIIGIHDDLIYEDDQVIIKVYAEEDEIIPEGTKIKVVPILADDEATKAQYEEVAAGLQEKAAADEQIIEGFLAYDITLVDPEGNEFEPNGEVKVTMDYKKAALPAEVENVEEAEVTIHHFEEDANGEVKQIVDMVAEAAIEAVVEVTEAAEVEKAEFVTTSFSTYTITWRVSNTNRQLVAQVVDVNGNAIAGAENIVISGTLGNDAEYNFSDNCEALEVGEKTYAFRRAVYTTGTFANGTNILAVRFHDGSQSDRFQYRTSDGWNVSWSDFGSNYTVYLVYDEVESLTTIDTVDHTAAGIVMTMTNYNNTGFNQNGFMGLGGGWASGKITQGLLKNKLGADGYPETAGGRSLKEAFSASNTTPVNHLFNEDTFNTTGYYEFNSFENYAYLNSDGNFTVYEQIGSPQENISGSPNNILYQRGHFYPYNNITAGNILSNQVNLYDEDGQPLKEDHPRYREELYKINNPDYYFGMYMETTFVQPEGGVVNGNDLIYEFNGDDDLWVFIDGVLALDLGGIHLAHRGYINYKTGEIGWDSSNTGDKPGNSATERTTIKAVFEKAGIFPDGETWDDELVDKYFKGDTFADYTGHEMKMFYMERGAGGSDIHVKFNLPVVPKGTIEVRKELTNTDKQAYANVEFAYQVFAQKKIGEEVGGYELYSDTEYEALTGAVYEGTKNLVKTNDAGDVFYLKADESAVFSGLQANRKYYVVEVDVISQEYDEIVINGTSHQSYDQNQQASAIVDSIETSKATVSHRPYVVFRNNCSIYNSRDLLIKKEMANGQTTDQTFTFLIKLESKAGQLVPYSGVYYVKDASGNEVTKNTTDGYVTDINVGDTIRLSTILSGTDFEVTEVNLNEQLFDQPTYTVTGSDEATLSEADGSGSIKLSKTETAQVVVTNSLKAAKMFVTKRFVGPTGTAISAPADLAKIKVAVREFSGAETVATHNLELTSVDGVTFTGELTNLKTYTEFEIVEGSEQMLKADGSLITNSADWSMFDWNVGELSADRVYQAELTNQLSGTTEVTVNKVWQDTGAEELRPKEIVVKVMNGQTEVATKAITATDEWTHTFTELPKYTENGTLISYTVQENEVPGYVSNVNGTTITNTLKKVEIVKNWNDANNVHNTRPTSLEITITSNTDKNLSQIIQLVNNAKDSHSLTIGQDQFKVVYDGWKATIYGMSLDSYTFEEDAVLGYSAGEAVVNNEQGTVTFTNTLDIQIVKQNGAGKQVLEGAVFQIKSGDTVYYAQSTADGKLTDWYVDDSLNGTPVEPNGRFTLSEVKAPAGYKLSTETWEVTFSNGFIIKVIRDGESSDLQSTDGTNEYALYFDNEMLYELPSTGGLGIYVPMMSGVIMMMAAAFILMNNKRKEVL